MYKYDLIWLKNTATGFAHAKNMPMRNYENIMVFSKGKVNHVGRTNNRMTYNPQGLRECEKPIINCAKTSRILHSQYKNRGNYMQNFTGYPKMVLEFNKKSSDSKFHINAKPVDLLEYLILTYTDSDAMVMDNCMGGGSTGVACVRTNRNFIGMEFNKDIFNIASERINNEYEIHNNGNSSNKEESLTSGDEG